MGSSRNSAYAGKTPWQVSAQRSKTVDDGRNAVAASLDWTVSKRRLWAEADNTAIQVPGYLA